MLLCLPLRLVRGVAVRWLSEPDFEVQELGVFIMEDAEVCATRFSLSPATSLLSSWTTSLKCRAASLLCEIFMLLSILSPVQPPLCL